jgi:hypothetical protein
VAGCGTVLEWVDSVAARLREALRRKPQKQHIIYRMLIAHAMLLSNDGAIGEQRSVLGRAILMMELEFSEEPSRESNAAPSRDVTRMN